MSTDTRVPGEGEDVGDDFKVVYKFRDLNPALVSGWNNIFGPQPYFNETIEV